MAVRRPSGFVTHEGGLRLPLEYADWTSTARSGSGVTLASDNGRYRIVAPRDGDRYVIPDGEAGEYATVALRAAGATGAVQWHVIHDENRTERWKVVPGDHTIRAVNETGESDEVRVRVVAGSRPPSHDPSAPGDTAGR